MRVAAVERIDKASAELERLNRLYDALRLVNQAIVHLRTREELFNEVCRIAVTYGGFALAWFGWIDPETHRVIPVSHYGEPASFLAKAKMYADDRPEGWGPTGLSIRSGRPYICNDYFNDPSTVLWRKEAKKHGFRASGTFPIRLENETVGVFGVYALETGYFQSKEIALLDEAAGDVSFALDNFAREAERVKALEESRLLAAIVESTNEAILSKSLDGTILSWNPAAERMFGYTAEEICGRNISILIPPERTDEEPELLRRVSSGERIVGVETEHVRKDGRPFPASVTISPLRCASGKVIGASRVIRDITERKINEAALRASEESLREAQKIAALGSFVLAIATGIWTSSDVLDEIFGIDKSYEHSVAGWRALIHPKDRARMSAHLAEEVLGQGKPFNREYRIIRQNDHAERWVQGTGRLEFDSQGRPMVMRGTVVDITERRQADLALRESKELLQLFIEHAPAALAMFDREMRYLAASRRWLENNALSGRDIIGLSHYETHPNIPEQWKEAHRRGLAGEQVRNDQDVFERRDGVTSWRKWEVLPWRTGDGDVGGIILFSEDITQQRRAEERLHLAASVFTHASEGITITDAEGTILDVNAAFTRITGYSREEVIGKNPRILNSGRQSKEFYAEMWGQLRTTGYWSGEIWNRARDGRVFPEILTISAVPDAMGKTQQYVALFADISSLKEQEHKLERLAHYDLLTGLPNRALLSDRLQLAMPQGRRKGRSIAIVCLDLDNFKGINEHHGRDSGDALLTVVANRLGLALRQDDMLARIGGDEFVAVLADAGNMEESIPMINRLLNAVAEPVELEGLTLQVSTSIGVTFFPQPVDVDAEQLLRQADQAMYQAKLEGKNRYHVFDAREDRSVRGHHEDVERIRNALHANEFVLYYQPKVNMRTGKVLGAEALIRWQHPEGGVLPPAQFLPIIEGNALAIELGDWVIHTALTQIENWRAIGLDVPVSVNISGQQLMEPNFFLRLNALMATHPSVPRSSLELEVLESSALQDLGQVSGVITACSEIGVSFALDDFGTGYSTLTYLRRLPADVLKIDRSFVREMLDDPEDLTMLEGVLSLVTAFRRVAVAEGVETMEQGLMLLRLGCQVAQGYGIARPMPASDLPAWAASWRPPLEWVNVSAVDAADRPLLYAGVEHKAWLAGIEDFLEGRQNSAPAQDPRHCRFGAWLQTQASTGYGRRPGIPQVEVLHRRVHTLAAEVLSLEVKGRTSEALIGLAELRGLRDELLARLQDLVRSS
jgi:diguanylate cyclase (GGDEF)-like protein/PAS domain S-box-containing protein